MRVAGLHGFLSAGFVRALERRALAIVMLVVSIVVAILVLPGVAAGVGPTRYASLVVRGRCSLRMRVPVSLELRPIDGQRGLFDVIGDGLPRHEIGFGVPTGVVGSCLPGGSAARIAAIESTPGSLEKLSGGACVARLTEDGGAVTYVVPLTGGALAFAQAGASVNAAVKYLAAHTRGRIIR